MADLLSASDEAEVRAAIGDVVDTFMQVPVQLVVVTSSLDRFQEDHSERVSTTHDLTALIEYEGEGEDLEVKNFEGGTIDFGQADVTFGYDYLVGQGLIDDDNQPKINPEQDYIIIEEVTFKIIGLRKGGQFKTLSTLVVLRVERDEKLANIKIVTGYDPFVDNKLKMYFNYKPLIINTDNIFGTVDASGSVGPFKDAKGTSAFNLLQAITTQKPLLGVNGLIFDSINDVLITSDVPAAIKAGGDFTFIVVGENLAGTATNSVNFQNTVSTRITHQMNNAGDVTQFISNNGGSAKVMAETTVMPLGTTFINIMNFRAGWDITSSFSPNFVDSSDLTGDLTNNFFPAVQELSVGQLIGGAFRGCIIKGILVYDSLITDVQEIADIKQFTLDTWG